MHAVQLSQNGCTAMCQCVMTFWRDRFYASTEIPIYREKPIFSQIDQKSRDAKYNYDFVTKIVCSRSGVNSGQMDNCTDLHACTYDFHAKDRNSGFNRSSRFPRQRPKYSIENRQSNFVTKITTTPSRTLNM